MFSAFNPSKCTHSSEHTPGAESSRRCGARGAVEEPLLKGLTSVVVLKMERTLVTPPRQFLPEPRFKPTTSCYKPDALTIRPRLPRVFIYYQILWFTHLLIFWTVFQLPFLSQKDKHCSKRVSAFSYWVIQWTESSKNTNSFINKMS